MKKKKKETILGLQKGVEKRDHTNLIKKEKELSPNTIGALKIVRKIVWFAMAFVFLVGVVQLVKSKQPKVIKNIHKYEFAECESEKAKTFAENFVNVYLTYGNLSESEYRNKILCYVNQAINLGKPEYANGESLVKESKTWEIEKIDSNKSNIIVKANLVITNKNDLIEQYDKDGKKVKEPKVIEKIVYVSVPINVKNNKIVVNDYPSFLNVDEKLESELETYYGDTTVEEKSKEEIKKMLEDFYDVYYSGTQGQIKTFFKQNCNLIGLNNEFKFKSIKSCNAYKTTDNKVKVVVVLEIQQNDIGAIFNQRHLIQIEKTNDRWVIIDLKNRGI